MGKRCVVGGCSNSSKNGHALHEFPKDSCVRRAWVRFVKVKRSDFDNPATSSQSVICQAHFTDSCYHKEVSLMHEFGLNRKRTLLPGSVPTIQPSLKRTCNMIEDTVSATLGTSSTLTRAEHTPSNGSDSSRPKRHAATSLMVARVSQQILLSASYL